MAETKLKATPAPSRDVQVTQTHLTLLQKIGDFVEGIPADAVDTLKIVGTVVADVATIKSQIGNGDYISIVSGLQSDIATLKAEVATLTSQVKSSLSGPSPAPTSTTETK